MGKSLKHRVTQAELDRAEILLEEARWKEYIAYKRAVNASAELSSSERVELLEKAIEWSVKMAEIVGSSGRTATPDPFNVSEVFSAFTKITAPPAIDSEDDSEFAGTASDPPPVSQTSNQA